MKDPRTVREIFDGISSHEKKVSTGYILYAHTPRKVEILQDSELYIIFVENFFVHNDTQKDAAIIFANKFIETVNSAEFLDENSTLHNSGITAVVAKRNGELVLWNSTYDLPLEEWYTKEEHIHHVSEFVKEILKL